jgi:hypothetical protein
MLEPESPRGDRSGSKLRTGIRNTTVARRSPLAGAWPILIALLGTSACTDSLPVGGGPSNDPDGFSCLVSADSLFDGGVGRDGIRALANPPLVPLDHPDAAYVQDDARVVGVRVAEGYVAIPHNILFRHEVVNLDLDDTALAVTYCPLTGSFVAFSREAVDGVTLGVSGLLFRSNLLVFDRRAAGEAESIWSQMDGRAVCGPAMGNRLEFTPAVEMTWEGWRKLHPDSRVVSSRTGFSGSYAAHRNVDYERTDNPDTLVPIPRLDPRRPPKERVLGIIMGGDGGMAYPFGELSRVPRRAIHQTTARGRVVLLWDSPSQGGGVFLTEVEGTTLSFRVQDGAFVDDQTGSQWSLAGEAMEGPLQGVRMELFPESYVAFWFAWAAFHPETVVWRPSLGS